MREMVAEEGEDEAAVAAAVRDEREAKPLAGAARQNDLTEVDSMVAQNFAGVAGFAGSCTRAFSTGNAS